MSTDDEKRIARLILKAAKRRPWVFKRRDEHYLYWMRVGSGTSAYDIRLGSKWAHLCFTRVYDCEIEGPEIAKAYARVHRFHTGITRSGKSRSRLVGYALRLLEKEMA